MNFFNIDDATQTNDQFTSPNLNNALAAVSFFCLAITYHMLPQLIVFGHDEVIYYDNVKFKLVEEGRWINFLLHDALRQLPPPLTSIVFVSLIWTAAYWLSRRSCPPAISCAIAVLIVSNPTVVEGSLWPTVHLLEPIALLVLLKIYDQFKSVVLIYLLAGLIFFGLPQHFYFLTPLIFFGSDRPLSIRGLAYHCLLFAGGSVLGLMVSLLWVYILAGQIGLTVADWRMAHPISEFADLLRNIKYALISLYDNTRNILNIMSGGHTVALLAALVVLCAFLATDILSRGVREDRFLLVLSAISFFVFSVPLAPVIQTRSLVALSTSIILLLFVYTGKSKHILSATCVLVTAASWNQATYAYNYFIDHHERVDFAALKLKSLLDESSPNFDSVAVFGKLNPSSAEAGSVNSPVYLHPIVLSTGVRRFVDCRVPSVECSRISSTLAMEGISPRGSYQWIGTTGKVGVIRLNEVSDN
ncbi:hypothetical protein [Phyllobacterium endophyticum]|uniref:Glycosyltransferase RgtA/B/C/D-like domain-containing protein n=1 Tax=Phyllobacterium endophyticum TaxID=1149773 RepID=A0A2P7AV72_9HYPH|nr:hypothetical protein [Phyllobacterium endophyticum]MBB3234625.1 hypothetical protein [Phyllobacterium endophyticum]PSH58091.1 hypothetical protein CU100_10600 [Phyllobacterium endophyticum]TYR38765.1 hypothetical protein FY050_22545 [Phyllobacterium endophyticum]